MIIFKVMIIVIILCVVNNNNYNNNDNRNFHSLTYHSVIMKISSSKVLRKIIYVHCETPVFYNVQVTVSFQGGVWCMVLILRPYSLVK